MERNTTACQLLLFSIKHTVSGLEQPQGQGVCECVTPQERGPVESIKGAVNLQKEGAGGRPTHTNTHVHTHLLGVG